MGSVFKRKDSWVIEYKLPNGKINKGNNWEDRNSNKDYG